jgi:uncharacterized membrane protein
MLNKISWTAFVFFAVVIGVYPIIYLLVDMSQGLFSSKPADVLQNPFWKFFFYVHIFSGGLALLIGWSQFVERFRDKYVNVHRTVGKIYLLAILSGGFAGLYIALFASGGIVSIAGFTGLAIAWLTTSILAYRHIRKGNINEHQYWMIRSYALCFAAVTLRIWLPLSQAALHMDFLVAYRIISWLCWVPNLIVAELMIRNLKTSQLENPATDF